MANGGFFIVCFTVTFTRSIFMLMEQNALPFTSRSPLRYPGGKTRGIAHIVRYFPKGITEMMSPFFGGGSVELFMTAQGVKVTGYDVFTSLVEFWQCLLESPSALAKEIEKWYPLSKEKFYHLQKIQTGLLLPWSAQRCIMC